MADAADPNPGLPPDAGPGASLRLPAVPESLDAVQEMLERQLVLAKCPEETAILIQTLAEEAFLNIVNYAYPEPGGAATVTCRTAPGEAVLEFRDSGQPFDPTRHHDSRQDQPLDQREAGGMGIVLMHKLSDRISYARNGEENALTLVKKWRTPTS